jgi:Uma2 family endonuclease
MATATKLVTAEEFWELPSPDHSELIDGVIVELSPPGFEHGHEQVRISALLLESEKQGLGYVFVETGCILRRNPDRVRSPDVGFILRERTERRPRAFFEGAPDLVVEIVSPGDRPTEILTKTRDWLDAGARRVWVVYPDSRTVHVVTAQERVVLTEDDTIDGGDAVPGFSCRVSEFFL